MRFIERGWLALQVGLVVSALAATGPRADAQAESAQLSSNSGTETTAIAYTAVLRDQQQPPNPNGPNQPVPQQPEPTRKPKYVFYLGPDIGVFLPASSKTSNRFGSDWLSVGVGISKISTPNSRGRFSPDIQILSKSSGDDSLFFGLVGVEYTQALIPGQGRKAAKLPPNPQPGNQPGQPQSEPPHNRDFIPYFGVSAYEAVGDLVAVEDNVHSGVRTGVAGAAFLGLEYRNCAYFEARYLQTSELKGFDLSGFSLTIGYRFKIVGY